MPTSRSYDKVHEQLMFDILLYLPVMSLLRFKAVCKDWFSLIESSTFVSEHLNHHRDSKEDNLIILGHVNDEPKFALLSGSQYEECVYDIGNWQCWHLNDVCVLGYCDGIVCLGHNDEIALWNPALNQLRPLPPSLFSSEKNEIYTCFGKDTKSNDYKVVRICMEYGDDTLKFIGNRVEVYNLVGDNSWRNIHEDDVLPFIGIFSNYARYSSKSGMCFWVACRSNVFDRILLSFDFNENLFRIMLLPHDICCGLDLLDDKVVCMVDIYSNDIWSFDDNLLEIWMLHEFGVEESWNIIYKIALWYPSLRLGISRNGEFLICTEQKFTTGAEEDTREFMFYLYNLHNQQGKFHPNCNLKLGEFYSINRNLKHLSGQLIHYDASLLSLKSANNVVRAPIH